MPYDAEVKWYLEIMLVDQMIAPVLEQERGNIALWRVHRRTAADGAGQS
jgi:hypothetical protein